MFSVVAAYLPYALVTAYMPGPNNILALHGISQNGWRRGKNIIFGIASGFFCVMVICASSCLVWGAAGGALQRLLAKYYRPFNILIGVILLICAVQIVLT